jgi:hypothetical protein
MGSKHDCSIGEALAPGDSDTADRRLAAGGGIKVRALFGG